MGASQALIWTSASQRDIAKYQQSAAATDFVFGACFVAVSVDNSSAGAIVCWMCGPSHSKAAWCPQVMIR
jgi:hypothetical protein